jgi:hypothetical protein
MHGRPPSRKRNLQDYPAALNAARENPYTMIRRGMIGRIGFFREKRGISSGLTRYFYDGRLCTADIKRVLDATISFSPGSQILFHSPVADWLGEVARSLAERHNLNAYNLPPILHNLELEITPDWELTREPIVLLPVVDSGKTLHVIDRALRKLRSNVRPRYIAIMCAGSRGEAHLDDHAPALGSDLRQRTVMVEGKSYDVEYLLIVEQEHYTEETLPPSLVDHAGSSFDLDFEPVELTSSAFWKMVTNAGWKGEDDVPGGRQSLGSVPNFPDMVDSNAPLIAYKLHRLLSSGGRPLPVDPLLVRKAELGTRDVTTSVVSMFDYDSIVIPSEDLENDELFRDRDPTPELEQRDWWVQLRSAQSPGTRAILIDEFRLGGGSLARLAEVCEIAGLTIERAAVLVDFGHVDKTVAGVAVQSLYRIPLLEDWS